MSKPTLEQSMSYKLRKEAFVSNLSGSSLLDINLVTYAAASAVFLWTVLARRGFADCTPSLTTYALDFLLNVGAVLAVFTIYSGIPLFLNLILIIPGILLLLPLASGSRQPRTRKVKAEDEKVGSILHKAGDLVSRPFLTNYRGTMLVATALAILAVDFRVFPRRFAKVETWGTSLMDLGVGSFVFSAGVVAARSAIKDEQMSAAGGRRKSLASRMVTAGRHSLPLLVLGVVRLISVKGLDYAEHVTEYGVHWNFFFTLGFLPPFVELCDFIGSLVRPSPAKHASPSRSGVELSQGPPVSYTSLIFSSISRDIAPLLISTTYELILNNTGLLSFILISPRTPDSDLLTKNREGIFSFFGYLAIFLSGRTTGHLVCVYHGHPPTKFKVDPLANERRVLLVALLQRTLVFSLLYAAATSVFNPLCTLTVSRRLANVPYVLWIAAYNNAQIAVMALIEHVAHTTVAGPARDTTSPILAAFNRNGLALFLLANLGTGLVNMTVDTLGASSGRALAILAAYAAVLAGVGVVMDVKGWKVKL